MQFYEYFEEGFGGKGEVWFLPDQDDNWQKVYEVTSTSMANPDKIGINLQPILSTSIGLNDDGQVKFRWIEQQTNDAFWWIVDDVFIYNNPSEDMAALNISGIPQGCVASLEHAITTTAKNLGTGNISDLNYNYQLNNGGIVTDSVSYNNPIQTDSFRSHTFDSVPRFKEGKNRIKVWTSQPNGQDDKFPMNDTTYLTVFMDRIQVTPLPMVETFEDTVLADHWCKDLGPSGNGRIRLIDNSVQTTCQGNQMIGMDTDGGSAIDNLLLAVNLSGCVKKELSFTYGHLQDDIDPQDGLYLSVDNGGTYHKIMAFDDSTATHDTCTRVTVDLDYVADTAGLTLSSSSILSWRHAGNDSLESGEDGFYLDSVAVDFKAPSAVDAGVTKINQPSNVSIGDTADVKVEITNFSADTLASSEVYYQFGNGPIRSGFWSGCLGQNEVSTFTFSKSVVIDSANKELCAWTEMPNSKADLDGSNDETCKTISNIDGTPVLEAVEIYPNPTKHQLNVEVPYTFEEATLSIYNIEGQLLSEKRLTDRKSNIDVSELANGLYIYQLQIGNNMSQGKISIVE
jgi:hypothetical protein